MTSSSGRSAAAWRIPAVMASSSRNLASSGSVSPAPARRGPRAPSWPSNWSHTQNGGAASSSGQLTHARPNPSRPSMSAHSATSRVLPMPGSPPISPTQPRRLAAARSAASCSSRSSASRPTSVSSIRPGLSFDQDEDELADAVPAGIGDVTQQLLPGAGPPANDHAMPAFAATAISRRSRSTGPVPPDE